MKLNLVLDSGAFSVRHAGAKINLGSYIIYCAENAEFIEKPVNLDVIPRDETREEVRRSAEAGYANWCRMRDAGIDAMPVVHSGEALDYVDRYAAACDWIGARATIS